MGVGVGWGYGYMSEDCTPSGKFSDFLGSFHVYNLIRYALRKNRSLYLLDFNLSGELCFNETPKLSNPPSFKTPNFQILFDKTWLSTTSQKCVCVWKGRAWLSLVLVLDRIVKL